MQARLPRTLSTHLDEAAEHVRRGLGLTTGAEVGWVLGSGLGDLVSRLAHVRRLAYAEVPHLAPPGVAGHAGELVAGEIDGRTVLVLRGRAHLYEGHPPARVVFGVRLLARVGVTTVTLTNAAGGIARSLEPGALMLISDHLNLTGRNPLVFDDASGDRPGEPSVAPPFVDLSDAYDPALRAKARAVADDLGLTLQEGVYAGLLGPSYETPAEIRMLATLGADAVGMSTVLETIALRHLGVRVLGLSSITNAAAGLPGAVLDHADVQRVAAENAERLGAIVHGVTRTP